MANELGLRSRFRELIVEPLNNFRGSDGSHGQEVRFLDFVNNEAPNPATGGYGLQNAAGQPFDWDSLLHELGHDRAFEYSTLDNLIGLGGELRYIAPEVVREFILNGFETSATHLNLVAGTESVDSMDVTAPNITYNEATMQDISQGETIPESAITWDKKTVSIGKKGIAIKLTDELLLSVKVPVLRYWLRRVGVQLGAILYRNGVLTLINGDQAGGADSCAVIGVGTQTQIAFADFVRPWVRAAQIAFNWNSLISSEDMTNTILAITEFKPNQGVGSAQVNIESRNRIIPSTLPHMISSDMNDNHVMLFDQAQAMTYVVFRPLLVEAERIIMRQIEGSAASIISGFLTIDRNARVIIDKSLAFSGNGFPARMTPLV